MQGTSRFAGIVVNSRLSISVACVCATRAPSSTFFRRLFGSFLVAGAFGAGAASHELIDVPVSITGFLEELRQGFALNHRLDQPVVLQEIDRVRRSPAYLSVLSPRIERYLPRICEEARVRGLPSEVCLLPIVESGVNPAAVSRSGARGLWQLIPGTAKRYGLKVGWRVDERRDPTASTDAALRYLVDLQRLFSDWTLALAAYNCGENKVAELLDSATAGASFFDLRWPRETAVYVPRLLAFAAIFADPAAHGIALPDRLQPNSVSTLKLPPMRTATATVLAGDGLLYRPASSLRETTTEPIAR
ncbi:MAG: lytic transglycosylase domain-containing protein [Gammaproteobacteria bacterium]|nr:lytic transglycosylase domain-containing protein [Gammaproteobacteria bacterium]